MIGGNGIPFRNFGEFRRIFLNFEFSKRNFPKIPKYFFPVPSGNEKFRRNSAKFRRNFKPSTRFMWFLHATLATDHCRSALLCVLAKLGRLACYHGNDEALLPEGLPSPIPDRTVPWQLLCAHILGRFSLFFFFLHLHAEGVPVCMPHDASCFQVVCSGAPLGAEGCSTSLYVYI